MVVCAVIFLIRLCGILRLHIGGDGLTKSGVNRILEFVFSKQISNAKLFIVSHPDWLQGMWGKRK